MINKKGRKEILLNETIIGTTPLLMKELILRGYRIMPVSSYALDTQEKNTQEKNTQKREIIIERGWHE